MTAKVSARVMFSGASNSEKPRRFSASILYAVVSLSLYSRPEGSRRYGVQLFVFRHGGEFELRHPCLLYTSLGIAHPYRMIIDEEAAARLLRIYTFDEEYSTLLAISIAAALGSGLVNLMIAAGIGTIPSYARTVRASVLTVKDQEYIEAARAGGASDLRIVLRHILPNCLAPIIVRSTLGVASAILTCASLSYIGLGIQPPTPEWG